jgi:uncharacterized protein
LAGYVDPARQRQDLGRLITEFTERVPEVQHALVVSSDGLLLAASDQTQRDHLDQLSAITAGLMSLARTAADIFDCGAVNDALVVMERGTLVVMAVGDSASLSVLTTAADLDLVAYEMTMLGEQVGSVIGSGTTDA